MQVHFNFLFHYHGLIDNEQKIKRYKKYKGREEPKVSVLDESGKKKKNKSQKSKAHFNKMETKIFHLIELDYIDRPYTQSQAYVHSMHHR